MKENTAYRRVGIVAGLLAMLVGASAVAQPKVTAKFRVIEPKKDPNKPKAPVEGDIIIRGMVDIEVPGLSKKDFELQDTAREDVALQPDKLVTFSESEEPMAMVILVQGNYPWMGNEMYGNEDEGTIYQGAYTGLVPAIDILAKSGPETSQAALVVYTAGKTIEKQAFGPARSLAGTALGTQKDYEEFVSRPLKAGLAKAYSMLVQQEGARRILVVFGDGEDDAADADNELRKIVDDLKLADIESYAVYFTSTVAEGDENPRGIQNMQKIGYTDYQRASSRDNFSSFAGAIVEFINSRYYVDFIATKDFPPGQYDVQVAVRPSGQQMVSDPFPITIEVETAKPEEASTWWIWLLIGIGAFLFLVLLIVLLKRKKPEPEPVEEEWEPEEFEPEPAHRRTVMLGVGGTAESMPVVGWVVPLNGRNQYQTFKLLQGTTRIGTGDPAHVVVDDGYMTLEHAEIVSSPNGFVLNDLGSTNGTYLNKLRISSHDLVDNDTFRLGKTEFRFKSIN